MGPGQLRREAGGGQAASSQEQTPRPPAGRQVATASGPVPRLEPSEPKTKGVIPSVSQCGFQGNPTTHSAQRECSSVPREGQGDGLVCATSPRPPEFRADACHQLETSLFSRKQQQARPSGLQGQHQGSEGVSAEYGQAAGGRMEGHGAPRNRRAPPSLPATDRPPDSFCGVWNCPLPPRGGGQTRAHSSL